MDSNCCLDLYRATLEICSKKATGSNADGLVEHSLPALSVLRNGSKTCSREALRRYPLQTTICLFRIKSAGRTATCRIRCGDTARTTHDDKPSGKPSTQVQVHYGNGSHRK
jgi:hypothetical protein